MQRAYFFLVESLPKREGLNRQGKFDEVMNTGFIRFIYYESLVKSVQ